MRTKMKRILSIALALCICLTMLPTVAMQVAAADPISMMVSYAQDRVGKTGAALGYNVAWCALFVSDCAAYAGQSNAVPKHANAHSLYFMVLDAGGKVVSSPQAGDLVFYNCSACDTNGDGISMMHVGLVENANYSIEGNLSSKVQRKGLNDSFRDEYYHYTTTGVVKRVYVRPAYSGITPHTCNKGTYVYYEAAHPHYKCYRCSICGQEWRNTAEPTTVSSCSSCVQRTLDSRYSSYLPMGAFPISDSNISVYDEYGTKYSNRYISGASDVCMVWEIYTDGWCKVTYPSESSGTFTAYVPFSVFVSAPMLSSWTSNGEHTVYRKSNMSATVGGSLGTVANGTQCLQVSQSGNLRQVIYPISGKEYCMMGWINAPAHAETPTVSWWLSETEYGSGLSEYKVGNRYYFCYRLYDKVTGTVWDEVENSDYTVDITYYNPDGSVLHTGHYTDDESWISVFFKKPGTYKMEIVIDGDFLFSGSRYFTVKDNPKKIYVATNAINLKLGQMEDTTLFVWTEGYYDGSTVVSYARSNSNISCSWGEQRSDGTHPLTITANSRGTATITVFSKDSQTGAILDSTQVTVVVDAKTYTISYNSNGGSGAPGSQIKYHNTPLTLSSTLPTQSGYTFMGWSTSSTATSASYQAGGEFNDNSDTTLYAVWKKGCEAGNHSYSYEEVPPTASYYGKLYGTCSLCGHKVTVALPALNTKDYVLTVLKEATCSEDGHGYYTWKTTTFGEYNYSAVIPATGHAYLSYVTEPNCASNGYTTHVCLRCSLSYDDEHTKALGHTYVNGVCIRCDEEDPAGSGMGLIGDITGDGNVNMGDVAKLYAHIKGTSVLTDKNDIKCCDITGDGNVNMGDVAKLYAHIKGTSKLY